MARAMFLKSRSWSLSPEALKLEFADALPKTGNPLPVFFLRNR
jgi:hypothetical protein